MAKEGVPTNLGEEQEIILGGLEKLAKDYSVQGADYDFNKHLTTIGSGAIVIIVAFVKQYLNTSQKIAIFAAIIGFLLSISFALWLMSKVGKQSQDIGNLVILRSLRKSEKDTSPVTDKIYHRWEVIERLRRLVSVFFGLGMLAAIAFFFLSVFRR